LSVGFWKQQLVEAWLETATAWSNWRYRALAVGIIALTLAAMACDLATGLLVYTGKMSEATAAWFRLSRDWSIWEMAGYCLWQASAVFAFLLARRIASPLHYAMAGLFQFLVAEDALQFHERAGVAIGAVLFPAMETVEAHGVSDIKDNDYGELVYAAIVLGVIGICFYACLRRATARHIASAAILCAPLALVIGAAVGIDFVQQFIPLEQKLLRGGVATLENGIELLGTGLAFLAACGQWLAVKPDAGSAPFNSETPSSFP
jgi:hypothetical protein